MSDFSFTGTAECSKCGAVLSSSDDDCDKHSEDDVSRQMFRRKYGEKKPRLITVESTASHKWYKLYDEVGSPDWLEYAWLGTREEVKYKVNRRGSIQDVPERATAIDAPNDVADES